MSDDSYDDGLVHSHGWLTEPLAHTRPAQPAEAEHDDGLVHGNAWASGDYAGPGAGK